MKETLESMYYFPNHQFLDGYVKHDLKIDYIHPFDGNVFKLPFLVGPLETCFFVTEVVLLYFKRRIK